MTVWRSKIREYVVYLAIWVFLFLAPIGGTLVLSRNRGTSFMWAELLWLWAVLAVYFVVFLVHNFLLVPLFIYRRKKLVYGIGVSLLVVVYALYQCYLRPNPMDGPRTHTEKKWKKSMSERSSVKAPPQLPWDETIRRKDSRHPVAANPIPPNPHKHSREPKKFGEMLLLFRPDNFFSVLVVLLIVGLNCGIKLYFKLEDDAKDLQELAKKNLEIQLAYLKYQLNPHFFMNTLNNIHALVDIDSEKAKETIIDLSKLMRYMLYETDRLMVPVEREKEFMENYVKLTRLRYPANKLYLEVQSEGDMKGILVPPLLVISFFENAFKHGVGGMGQAYIMAKTEIKKDEYGSERVVWTCRNSKPSVQAKPQTRLVSEGGVGIANTRQRLDLIYGDDYTLLVDDQENEYTIIMNIPAKRET